MKRIRIVTDIVNVKMSSGDDYVRMETGSEVHSDANGSFDSLEKLKAICKMLRDHGDRIMRGETSITLTGKMLYDMNESLDNFQDGLSPQHLALSVQDGAVQGIMQAADLEAWNFHLRLLQDVVSRAPMLTVYSGGDLDRQADRSGIFPVPTAPPVRLCYFISLQHLHLSFIPIGLIQDMLKLRPRLESLSLTNCLPQGGHLQDILEVCEQDISVPMQWTSLKYLCLRCNGLRELDGSLRLCPVLQTVDLSRNRLATTDVYLGYLMELHHIDLRYNCLDTLPVVAATAKKTLHTLLLAGNRLTDLTGIDDMDSLVVLDLAENHISTHSNLAPLRQLHRLEQLCLTGCPISVKKQHRVVTLHCVSALALSRKFTLDGKLATVNEIRNSRMSVHREISHYQRAPSANLFTVQSRPAHRVGDSSHLFATGNAVDGGLATNMPVTGKRKIRKKAKQRTLEIVDMDTSTGGEVSSREESPASSFRVPSRLENAVEARRKEVRKTREEIEELRRHYGDNWLQAITDQEKLPLSASTKAGAANTASSAVGAAAALTTKTSDKSLQPDAQLLKDADGDGAVVSQASSLLDSFSKQLAGSGTEMRRVVHWNSQQLASTKGTADQQTTSPHVEGKDDKQLKTAPHQQTVCADIEIKAFSRETMLPGSSPETDGMDSIDGGCPSAAAPEKSVRHIKEGSQGESEYYCSDGTDTDGGMTNRGFMPDESGRQRVNNAVTPQGSSTLTSADTSAGRVSEVSFQNGSAKKGDRSVAASESSPHHDGIEEPEDQSEPFIVTLPDKGDDPLIITVSPRYLVEKDINGKIKEILDLQSLEAAKIQIEEKGSAEDGSDVADRSMDQIIKVRMDFSYVRKDRRLRVYVMEDFTTAQHLMELAQPFLEAKVEAAMRKLMTEYQCLKCNEKFTAGEALTAVQLDNMLRVGSIRDFKSMSEMGGEKVILMCPKCQSDHIILLESGEGSQSGAETTPVGSLTATSPRGSFRRKQSLDQLMGNQSPVAHSTPFKQQASSSDTQFSRSVDRGGWLSRASKKGNPSRNLFTPEDQELVGDGPDTSGGSDPAVHLKQDGTMKGRQRSNAFYGDFPPSHDCSRSFEPGVEGVLGNEARRTSSLVNERTAFTAAMSSSLSAVPVRDGVFKSTVSTLNKPHLAGSSHSADEHGGWGQGHMASVDSDITILGHHDSVGSLGAASSKSSDTETITTETRSIPATKLTPATKFLTLEAQLESRTEAGLNPLAHAATASVNNTSDGTHKGVNRDKQSVESTEVTPLGSPLSSSVCSSMVSSIYYNSLQPNTSSSNTYLTASEQNSVVGEGEGGSGKDEDEELETSIYDMSGTSVRTRSPHKESISSEVEVLMVEQAVNETLASGDVSSDRHSDEHDETFDDSDKVDGGAGAETGEVRSDASGGSEYDFDRLDHRLALHLMMAVFDNSEEFSFKTKTTVCQYMMEEEYGALVVVTNMKIYILRITSQDVSVEPKDALNCVEIQPLAELKRVEVGLGGQTIRLEFKTDCSSYTLIMFNEDKVEAFVERLRDHLKDYALETSIPMTTVFNEGADKQTQDNLAADVLHCEGQADSLRLFSLGYIARGHNLHYPIAFVVSAAEVCLVRTNHQWPSPRLQAPVTVETVGRQFVVLERQKINNIATIARHSSNKRMVKITFFNETSGEETQWLITMEIEKGIVGMIEAIRQPWEDAFGVQMDIESENYELCL